MAMNLRVPEDLGRRLYEVAADAHTSKSAPLQGAVPVLRRHGRRREISEGLDFASHDAELLKRLEDA